MGQAAGERTPDTLFLRVVSAVVLVTIAVGATWFGAPAFDIVVALFAMAMIWEWAGMCGIRLNSLTGWLLGLGVLFVILFAALERYEGTVIAGLASMILLVGLGSRREKRWAVAGVLSSWACPALLLSAFGNIRNPVWCTYWLCSSSSGPNDIGGYVFGRMIGGVKARPENQPQQDLGRRCRRLGLRYRRSRRNGDGRRWHVGGIGGIACSGNRGGGAGRRFIRIMDEAAVQGKGLRAADPRSWRCS